MDFKTEYNNTDIDPFFAGTNACSISYDGILLATANFEDCVVTNLETGESETISGDGELITNLILTPDGSKLAIISQSQQLRVYDVALKLIVHTHKLSSPVYVSARDSTSTLLAFGGTDGGITVWDIENNYITHSLKGHGTTISCLEFHGDLNSKNWKLASGDTQGMVKVWDLVKRKAVHSFQEHTSAVRGVSFDQSGEFFLSGGRDEVVVIYRNFKPLKTMVINQQIEAAKFVSDEEEGLRFLTAGGGNVMKVYDVESEDLIGQTVHYETEEELVIMDVIETSGLQYYLVESDQTLIKVELEGSQISVVGRVAGNHGIIADIKYVGPNFDMIALATNSPGLRIVDVANPLQLNLLEGHTDLLNVMDVSLDGEWLVTGSKDSEARLWKYNEGTFGLYAVFKGHVGSVTAVGLPRTPGSPKFLITASTDLTIKKWKVPKASGETVKTSEYTRRAHDKDINAIDISPNDQYLATASYDKLAKVWDLESGETVGVLKGHRRGLWDIKFSKYDKKIITSSGDKTVKLWSLLNYQIEQTLEGHTNSVQKIQFMTRGSQVISAGADGLIKLWNAKTGECLKTLDNHSNRIWSIDVKNDGMDFVSADANGQISIWTDNSEELRQLNEQESVKRVEQEQNLKNMIQQKDFKNAVLIALELNYSMKLFEILKEMFDGYEEELVEILNGLNGDQLVKVFEKIRAWNINFKNFEVSQNLLYLMMNRMSLTKFEDGRVMKLVGDMIPYNERHLKRVEGLVEDSYMLDYSVEQMN